MPTLAELGSAASNCLFVGWAVKRQVMPGTRERRTSPQGGQLCSGQFDSRRQMANRALPFRRFGTELGQRLRHGAQPLPVRCEATM